MSRLTIYDREKKSNFGLTQIIDPIGLFGGKPIWDTGKGEQKAAYKAYQEQQRQEQDAQIRMRNLAIKSASAANAYQIRKQVAQGERSAKIKSGLMIGGIVGATLLIGTIIAVVILKKKK